MRAMQFSLKQMLILTAVIALTVWFLRGAYLGLTLRETGEHAPSVSWLPDEATDVSYYRSYSFTAYEFDISESGFREWSHWDVAEITEPVGVTRYTTRSRPFVESPSNPTESELEDYFAARAERYVKIHNGLYYEYQQSNGGGVWVGYDRDNGRAYYNSMPR